MEKIWYKRVSVWGTVILTAFAIIEGLANIEPAWEFLQNRSPQVFRLLNPLVVFWSRPITLSLWLFITLMSIFVLIAWKIRGKRDKKNFRSGVQDKPESGKTKFKNLWIWWSKTTKYGVFKISEIRCGVCSGQFAHVQHFQGHNYLVCVKGHFVGTDDEPEKTAQSFKLYIDEIQKQREEQRIEATEQHKKLLTDVSEGRMTQEELRRWEMSAPSTETLAAYTQSASTYFKLEEIVEEFQEELRRQQFEQIPEVEFNINKL